MYSLDTFSKKCKELRKKYLEPVQVIDFTTYREKVSKQMKFPDSIAYPTFIF